MNYNDHNPPRFHARYQDQEVIIEIKSGITNGKMSKRALQLIYEWMEKYESELLQNWELAKGRKPLKPIQPLASEQ